VMLAAQHRFREAIALWTRVMELGPGSEYARRARRAATLPFGVAGPVSIPGRGPALRTTRRGAA
jgi:hypothetical protein